MRVRDQPDAAGIALEALLVDERVECQSSRLSGRGTANEGPSFPPVCLSASPAKAGEKAG